MSEFLKNHKQYRSLSRVHALVWHSRLRDLYGLWFFRDLHINNKILQWIATFCRYIAIYWNYSNGKISQRVDIINRWCIWNDILWFWDILLSNAWFIIMSWLTDWLSESRLYRQNYASFVETLTLVSLHHA